MRTRTARALIYLAAIFSLGHHVDHAVRGNHIGWPLSDSVTPFTYSLAVYPLIILGLYLSLTQKVGAGYWMLLSGSGVLFLSAVHFGPMALEPPGDIANQYDTPLLGWGALAWLLTFIAVLAIMFVHETQQWHKQRQRAN